jgi:hypothetical protein
MQCFEPKIETTSGVSNDNSLQYTCTGRLVRPEGFEEYVTTLTFKQEEIDSSLLPDNISEITLCTDLDLDAVKRPLRMDKCYLLQMKVRRLHLLFPFRKELKGLRVFVQVSKAQHVPAYPEVIELEML